MYWRTPRGTFLIERNRAVIPFAGGGVGLEGGPRYADAAEFFEAEAGERTGGEGVVVRTFGAPMPFSIEDEMTVSSIHRVVDGALYRFYYSQRYRHPAAVKADLLIDGLTPVTAADLPFDAAALAPPGPRRRFRVARGLRARRYFGEDLEPDSATR